MSVEHVVTWNTILLLICFIVVVVDLWIIYHWRRYHRQHGLTDAERAYAVYIWGEFSPVLTWLRARLSRPRPFLTQTGMGMAWYWFWLVLAVVGVTAGNYLLARHDIWPGAFPWAREWSNRFRLDLVNVSNVVTAVPLLFFGGLLFALAVPSSAVHEWQSEAWSAWTRLKWKHWLRYFVSAAICFGIAFWQLWHNNRSWMPFALWLLALGLLTLIFWHWDRQSTIKLRPGLTSMDSFWLCLLLLAGLTVGAWYLLDIPARMVGDEGSFWEAARAIAVGEGRPSPFGLGVYTFPIASSLLQGFFMRLFGVTVWGWRFSSVLAGVLALIPLYLLAREWFGRRVAVVAGLAMLANPYFLAFARLGYNNSQALFPVTLSLYFWSMGLKRSSYLYCWLAGLAAGLGFYTYTAAQLGLVVILFTVPYLALRRQVPWRQLVVITLVMLLAWGLFLAPRLVLGRNDPPAISGQHKLWESFFANVFYGRAFFSDEELFRLLDPINVGHQQLFFEPTIYAWLLFRGLVRSMLVFHTPFFGAEEHFVQTGLAGGIGTAVFYTLGLFLSLRRWRETRFTLLLLWFGSGVLALSAANSLPPRPAHLVAVAPCIALFIGVALVTLADALTAAHLGSPLRARIAGSLILVGIAVMAFTGLPAYFGKLFQIYPATFEQSVAWTAWRIQDPTVTLAYVEPEPRHHDVAYLVWAKMIPLTYHNLATADLTQAVTPLRDTSHLVVFFPLEVGIEEMGQWMRAIPELRRLAPVVSAEGAALGYVASSIEITTTPSFTVAGGLHSILSSPVRSVWLGLWLALTLLGIWVKRVAKPAVDSQTAGVTPY